MGEEEFRRENSEQEEKNDICEGMLDDYELSIDRLFTSCRPYRNPLADDFGTGTTGESTNG
jgi:hypothetical protein